MMDKIMEFLTPKRIKILAVILCMMLIIGLVCCSGPDKTPEETTPPTTPTEVQTDPPTEPETEPPVVTPAITVNMGTVTTGELNIRKGPNSGYESVGSYKKGDRIEILETKTEDGTRWGRTNLGWVGMGYVREDGVDVPSSIQSTDANAPKIITNANSNVLGYGVVNLGELNVRMGPGTNYAKVAEVTISTRYAYYQLDNGWARIEDGWVSTEYFYIEGSASDSAFTGTINTDDVNIRTGPDTTFQIIGTHKKGDTVEILARVEVWGYTEKGWVYITYIDEVEPTYTTGAGRVTIGLNIRTEPNAESEIAGTYIEGDLVTILEVNGNWGKTDKGWINLKYVELS